MPEPLMTPPEVADRFRVPLGTIYQWRSRETGPRGIRIGKHLRYKRSDVEAWLDQRADEPEPA